MIEKLKESRGIALGFSIAGELTPVDVEYLSTQLDSTLSQEKKPIGLLLDISSMHGASWTARWDEMRFLQHHSDHIARMAMVSNDKWQEIAEMVVVASAALQAETLYFTSAEISHAWHWVKMNKMDEQMPVRVMYPGKGLFQDYTPEFMGI